jgi:hypothetical protein
MLATALLTLNSVSAQNDSTKKGPCKNDSTKMTFKNFDVVIIERNACEIKDKDTVVHRSVPKDKFSTWPGIYLGVNGFLTPSNSLNIGDQNRFIELDYSKSITFGLNFADVKFKIVPKYVSLVTGLGIQWNKYGLKNNYNLYYNDDSVYGVKEPLIAYTKNKLSATYLQVPLMFEIKTHEKMSRAFHFGFGVVGAYKLGSNLKQEYVLNGFHTDGKVKGHYQLNPFQAYATVRLGYGKHFSVFANYGLTSLFEAKKGPDLRPFTVGIYLPF